MRDQPLGLNALTRNDAGQLHVPDTADDWREWVSATAIRHYLLDDTLVDWLDEYGEESGFQPDDELPGYDVRTDLMAFLFEKAMAFEAAVVAHLTTYAEVTRIAPGRPHVRQLGLAEDTVRAMAAGVPIIGQAVLRDPESRTYGIADLLVRSDELYRLIPTALTPQDAAASARAFPGARWHYRVVDIKFTTLQLLAGGDLANSGSLRAYKGQLFIYNRALSRIQGYAAPVSYLLGRSWVQRMKKQTIRGNGCLERLGRVVLDDDVRSQTLAKDVGEAVAWVRRLRRDGMSWKVLPEPSVQELRPNMAADGGSWKSAKRNIAYTLEELTCLWRVGATARRQANARGLYRWSDPRCTPAALGVDGDQTAPVLQAILKINRGHGPAVAPGRITAAVSEWRDPEALEFYVDFETVSDLDDDFSQMPDRGGLPLIFMIGCGHLEGGEWRFDCFTADALTEDSERKIVNAWLAHMRSVRMRLARDGVEPRVIHWSHAETSSLRDAYNAAIRRHPAEASAWSTPRWFDFLHEVIHAEPVVVRGAFGFGLKAIAQSLWQHGLIETHWTDGPADGLGAMVGAWASAREAMEQDAPLIATDLMQGIRLYNEVDCKAMMEVVRYLRAHHLAPDGQALQSAVPADGGRRRRHLSSTQQHLTVEVRFFCLKGTDWIGMLKAFA